MTLQYEALLDAPFGWGHSDCFSLVQKFYLDNFDIRIRDYARPSDWSSDKLDLMRLCYEREGFQMLTEWKLKDLRPADVLCMAIGEQNANHFAVYLGDEGLVHHLYGRRSSREDFRGFYRNAICYVLRHPEVPDLRPVYPDVDIRSLLDARNSL